MIETLGFQIKTKGDESVGIFPNHFELKFVSGSHFQFDDINAYDEFLIDLKSLFREHLDDEPIITPIAYLENGKTMSEIWGDRIRERN